MGKAAAQHDIVAPAPRNAPVRSWRLLDIFIKKDEEPVVRQSGTAYGSSKTIRFAPPHTTIAEVSLKSIGRTNTK